MVRKHSTCGYLHEISPWIKDANPTKELIIFKVTECVKVLEREESLQFLK